MIYIINFCDACNCTLIHWLRDLQFIFPLVNCSLNQFLYAWKSRNFRRAISAALSGTVSYEATVPSLSPTGIVAISSKHRDDMELLPLDPVNLLTPTTEGLGEVNENIPNFIVMEE